LVIINTLTFDGWGEGINLYYMVVLYGMLFVTVVALIAGYIGSSEVTIGLEINRLNSPYFKMGVCSERYPLEDDTYEDEVSISFFFISVVIVFWKTPD
jgi:uncharacterized oligopeptide transporter (OPT) family protein